VLRHRRALPTVRPLDPRLSRYARATRGYLAVTVGLGLVTTALIITQAAVLAHVIASAEQRGADLAALRGSLVLLAVVVALRALASYGQELGAHLSSAKAMSQLRHAMMCQAVDLGPGWLAGEASGELALLAGRGVEALDPYFARYLPQLVLSALVPLAVFATIVSADWVSALIIGVTLPLIPIFMALIGIATRPRMRRQWRALSTLSAHILDIVAGLPTLRLFGRARAQADLLRRTGEDYRRTTMSQLRLAFLSAFVLELLSTLSVALIAVSVGLRLLHGSFDLETGLLVLILAPEAYLPVRAVGAQFHASMEGVTAAERVFEVLETQAPTVGGHRPVPDLAAATIRLDGVTVSRAGRDRPALDGLDLALAPRERVALVGPSGTGKSTVLALLLGFLAPTAGTIRVGDTELADLDVEQWRRHIAWVPQRPYLFSATVADNVRLGAPGATDAAVWAALRQAEAATFVALPAGLATRLGEHGTGLSAGQRQRIALARAFLRDAPLLLLDEPTAGLDAESEAAVLAAIERLSAGRTVLLVAHRGASVRSAERVVVLPGAGGAQQPVAVGRAVGAVGGAVGAPA
jgi:thiol reductant ABC exporter CydD subunit